MRKLLITLMAAGALVAFGASPSVAGGGNVKQFCKAWLVVKAAEDGPSERQANRALDTSPPDIADAVETAFTLFQEQGDAAFGDATFQTAYTEINSFVVDECGYENYDVSMQDYAFTGVPDEVEKGKVAFTLTNEGAELHEFSIYRIKGDATVEDFADATEEELEDLGKPVKGGGFGVPGSTDVAFFNLKKTGAYVAICHIPVGTTPDAPEGGSGPAHYMEGMIAGFEVT